MPSLLVIAAPQSFRTRVGAKFDVSTSTLRIGASRDARIIVAASGSDLELSAAGDGLSLQVKGRPVTASIGGVVIGDDARLALRHGDVLFVEPGWAFTLAPVTSASAFSPDAEAGLARAPDDEHGWSVYIDWLLERGCVLGNWLRNQTPGDARLLGRLADPVRTDALRVTWSPRGVIDTVRITREGLTRLGAWWLLRALAEEPAFRFVRALQVEAFLGHVTPVSDDAQTAELVDAVAALPCVGFLREFGVGYLQAPVALPKTNDALARLAAKTPLCLTTPLPTGPHASLELLSLPPGVVLAGLSVGDMRGLSMGRTEVGALPTAHLRLVGSSVPLRACVVVNAGGTFSVGEAQHDSILVNGRAVTSQVLLPGDVLEPLRGLQFRFRAGQG